MDVGEAGHGALVDGLGPAAGETDGIEVFLHGAVQGQDIVEQGGERDRAVHVGRDDGLFGAGESEFDEILGFGIATSAEAQLAEGDVRTESAPAAIVAGDGCGVAFLIRPERNGGIRFGNRFVVARGKDACPDSACHGFPEVHLEQVARQRILDGHAIAEQLVEMERLNHVGLDEGLPRHGRRDLDATPHRLGEAPARKPRWWRHSTP